MSKALPITELFQIIKRCIKPPALHFQKCYEHDQNMRAKGLTAEGHKVGLGIEAG